MITSINTSKRIFGLLALVAAAVAISGKSQAMVQPDGTFVPSRCGQQQVIRQAATFDVSVRQACVGSIAGENGQRAVSFTMSDASTKVFRIAQMSTELEIFMDGNVKSIFQLVNESGEHATMKVIASAKGEVLSATGHVGAATYFIPAFENVFVIQ